MPMNLRPILAALVAACASCAALAVPPDRGDLAFAYMRFERAVAETKPTGARLAEVNRAFDSLTGAFFAGDYASALNALAGMTARLEAERTGGVAVDQDAAAAEVARATAAWRGMASRRIVGVPRAVVRGAGFSFELRAEALDGVRDGDAPRAVLVVDGEREVARAEWSADKPMTLSGLAPAEASDVRVHVALADGRSVEFGRIAVLAAPLAEIRSGLAARLATLRTANQAADPALDAVAARLALLADAVERGRSAALVADLSMLSRSIEEELARAERGERPFFGVRGTLWRPFRLLGAQVPVAVHAPKGPGPFPVVVAFHGAGGDECMFFEGYGMGELRRLAEELGFVAVCPVTVPFATSPNLLDALLAEVGEDLPIDRSRVVLIGHSLGAVTASRLAALKPDSVQAAALIAGFADVTRSKPPATRRLWAAELDPLFPVARLEAERTRLEGMGRTLEIEVVKDQGHTLVVGAVLGEAVRWALEQAARETSPPAAP